MNELEELKAWCESVGYKIYPDHLTSKENMCKWVACKRLTGARECETNKHKIQLVISPYMYFHNDANHLGCSVDITGERGGHWYKLQAYSLAATELKDSLNTIEQRLIDAWNAL